MSYPMTNFILISTRTVGGNGVVLPGEPEPVLRATMNGKIRVTMSGGSRSVKPKG